MLLKLLHPLAGSPRLLLLVYLLAAGAATKDTSDEPTSSMTRILHACSLHTPLLDRSRMRPGVATTTWMVWYSLMISSLRLVPPVVTITSTLVCFPSSLHTCAVCSASSLVGTSSMAAAAATAAGNSRPGRRTQITTSGTLKVQHGKQQSHKPLLCCLCSTQGATADEAHLESPAWLCLSSPALGC